MCNSEVNVSCILWGTGLLVIPRAVCSSGSLSERPWLPRLGGHQVPIPCSLGSGGSSAAAFMWHRRGRFLHVGKVTGAPQLSCWPRCNQRLLSPGACSGVYEVSGIWAALMIQLVWWKFYMEFKKSKYQELRFNLFLPEGTPSKWEFLAVSSCNLVSLISFSLPSPCCSRTGRWACVYACVCLYMCVHMPVCVHMCVHACVCTRTCVCASVSVCVCVSFWWCVPFCR